MRVSSSNVVSESMLITMSKQLSLLPHYYHPMQHQQYIYLCLYSFLHNCCLYFLKVIIVPIFNVLFICSIIISTLSSLFFLETPHFSSYFIWTYCSLVLLFVQICFSKILILSSEHSLPIPLGNGSINCTFLSPENFDILILP